MDLMGLTTDISWTNATWNPWQGCTKVSAGCTNCYMFREKKHYGQDPTTVVRSKPVTFNAPVSWSHGKLAAGSRIFVCSWSDFFHKDADAWRKEAWDIIWSLPQYQFLIPTKRIERAKECLPSDWGDGYPNVWLGISAENQKTFDDRITFLLDIPAPVHWVSAEPLLEPIYMDMAGINYGIDYPNWSQRIEWVVVGGESGPQYRPMHKEWAQDIVAQCRTHDVPVFVKQLGGWPDTRHELSDFPEDLRIREFPR
jgi:protein gp37